MHSAFILRARSVSSQEVLSRLKRYNFFISHPDWSGWINDDLDALNAVFVLLRFRNIRHDSYAVILLDKTPYSTVRQREEMLS